MAEEGRLEALQASIQEGLAAGTKGASWDLQLYVRPWDINLTDIKIPVRLFHGTQDRNVPVSLVREMVQQLPGATLTEFPNDGHVSSLACHFDD